MKGFKLSGLRFENRKGRLLNTNALKPHYLNFYFFWYFCGSGRVVDIAIGYGLDGPGIDSWWERDFPHLSRPTLGPTRPSVKWVPSLSGGKERPGRDADLSPPSSAMVMKE
jgi:hypothetical protein